MAHAQQKQGNLEEAIDNYKKSLKLNPQKPAIVYKNLGNVLSQLQKTDEAIEAYKKSLELQPNNPEVDRCLKQLKARISDIP